MKFQLRVTESEVRELEQILKAQDWPAMVFELDGFLRQQVKHGADDVKTSHYQEVRDELHRLMNAYDLRYD